VTTDTGPQGEERQVRASSGTMIDGTPITYVIVWAAIVAALSYVILPVSAVLGIGGTFPMSQAVYALVGFILGPTAGALAAGIGRVIGIVAAPHTATSGIPSALVAVVWAAAGGLLVDKRGPRWLLGIAIFVLAYAAFVGRALTRDVSVGLAIQNTITNLSGIALWLLPTRILVRKWMGDRAPAKLAAGLALGCWMANTCGITFGNAINYFVNPWPANIWRMLVPIIPAEQLVRTIVGTIVGSGVIAGLRAIGLLKPAGAGY